MACKYYNHHYDDVADGMGITSSRRGPREHHEELLGKLNQRDDVCVEGSISCRWSYRGAGIDTNTSNGVWC